MNTYRVVCSAVRPLRSWIGILLLSLVLLPVTGLGQVLGSISGAVRDPTGSVMPGASVTVTNSETGLARTLITDQRGSYRALSLPAGRYDVKVQAAGFRNLIRFGIDLVVAQDAVLDLDMQLGVLTEDVEITGNAPLVSVATTSISGLVDGRNVKDLPLNGRSFDNLITLNPGTANFTANHPSTATANAQGNNFSVSGNRQDYNLFLLNGIEYTGISIADVTPGALSGQLLGVDAVREFNVLLAAYSAEYGKRPGGQISMVTMSGSNQIHGSLFGFHRNSYFDGRNFFDQVSSAPPFKRNQFGAAAGGPIRKDKTFVFGSYEGFRQRLAVSEVAVVPDDNARRGYLPAADGTLQYIGIAPGIEPYFSLWPAANGPELGGGAAYHYANPSSKLREDFGSTRVDQLFSAADMLTGVYTVDDSFNDSPGTTSLQATVANMRSQVASLQETHTFRSSVINNLRGGFSRSRWLMNAAAPTGDPSLSFVQSQPIGNINIGNTGSAAAGSFAGAGANGALQYTDTVRNLFTITDSVSIVKGIHRIELGAWFQKVQSNADTATLRYGSANFSDLQHFMQGQATQVTATLSPIKIGWRQTAGAWYAQDSVQLRRNLTLTVGVRHEFNNGWNSPRGMAANFVPDANGVLQTQPVVGTSVYSVNNAKFLIGPRAGLAWSPISNTTIHVGYGLYFEQLDYMASCCDSTPIGEFNNRVTVSPATFPLHFAPGQSLPGARITPNGVQPDLKSPAVFHYTFRVDRGLSANTLLSVGYVRERGYHLLSTTDANTAIPTMVNGAPYFPARAPRRNPDLANSRYVVSSGYSNYNALQFDLTQRFSRGLQYRVNYTFSKSLDNHSSSFIGNEGMGGTVTYMHPDNPRLDYGPSNFDLKHRLAGNFTYELPVGKGRKFVSGGSTLANAVFGGWQINTILSAQTGFPFTALVGFNQSRSGDTRNPDRVSVNPAFSGDRITGTVNQWFNPAAFLLPPAGTLGDTGRNILTAPGLLSVDCSMFKTFPIRERLNLELRTEFFNVLNHTNLGMPLTTAFVSSGGYSPSAGTITGTSTTSRQLQLALKLNW